MLKSHYRYHNGKRVANQIVEGLPLTARELEALEHFSNDLGAKQVAVLMGITQSTAQGFAENVRVKLGKRSICGCVAFGLRSGLIR